MHQAIAWTIADQGFSRGMLLESHNELKVIHGCYSLYLMHHNDDFSSTEPLDTNWNTWQDIVFLIFETLLFKKMFAQYWEYFRNRTAASSSINPLFLFFFEI